MESNPPSVPVDIVEVRSTAGVACKQCGYALDGLTPEGLCPECGLPVERSLTDNQLRNSAPAYLASLHRGVFLILAGVITNVLNVFLGFGLGIMVSATLAPGVNFRVIEIGSIAIGTLGTIAVAWGWWLFSTPDPVFTGRFDGSNARKVVRVSVVVNAAISLASGAVALTLPKMGGGLPAGGPTPGGFLLLASILLGLLSLVAWAVSFFASMLYLRWLCPRIPNWKAQARAKTMMWLGPLLYTVGALCIGLGPLVAMVLYWNMLDWIRKDIRVIRSDLGLI